MIMHKSIFFFNNYKSYPNNRFGKLCGILKIVFFFFLMRRRRRIPLKKKAKKKNVRKSSKT